MRNWELWLLIIGIIMAIYFIMDFKRNPDNYSAGDDYQDPSWCSGIFCD